MDYKPNPDLWVHFSMTSDYRGCGNMNIASMQMGTSTKDGKSPFASPVQRDQWGYLISGAEEGTPQGGIRLSELGTYLKGKYSGKEIMVTFARYPQAGKYGSETKWNDHFEAWELMELLENSPEWARRVSDWYNTGHNPPSHLRSYVILFHSDMYPVSDEARSIV